MFVTPDHGPRLNRASVRPRVLLIAEQANPELASVPLEGWSHSRALMNVADVHIVTQIRNRNAFVKAGLEEGRDFTAIDSERVARPIHRLEKIIRGGAGKGWTTVMAMRLLPYVYFERLVWRHFRSTLKQGDFDLVHRLTPLSPTLPSLLARRCRRAGVPFIIGPINGGLPWPNAFEATRRREREWLSYLREAHKLIPGYHTTRVNASAIIVGSMATARQMSSRYDHKCVYIPENGIDPARFSAQRAQPGPSDPLRVVFLGRLVPYKLPDALLDAAEPLIREGRLSLTYIGDGPEAGKLRRLVSERSLTNGVELLGWVDHADVQHILASHDLLALPSIREFGGAVVLEAMASGLVPLVVDYGGPGELVTPATGYKVPLGTRDEIVDHLRNTLARLADHPEELAAKQTAALQRVQTVFTWDAKAQQVCEVYRWVLGRRDLKPDYGMPLDDDWPDAVLAEPEFPEAQLQ
jgi:glycosyltransferase involved in cell wall biosynthesis